MQSEAEERAEVEAAIHKAAGISAILLCGSLRRGAALQVLCPTHTHTHTQSVAPPSPHCGAQRAYVGARLQGTHARPVLARVCNSSCAVTRTLGLRSTLLLSPRNTSAARCTPAASRHRAAWSSVGHEGAGCGPTRRCWRGTGARRPPPPRLSPRRPAIRWGTPLSRWAHRHRLLTWLWCTGLAGAFATFAEASLCVTPEVASHDDA